VKEELRLDRDRNKAIEKAGAEIADAILKAAKIIAGSTQRGLSSEQETKGGQGHEGKE
jgi:hypothetical protein